MKKLFMICIATVVCAIVVISVKNNVNADTPCSLVVTIAEDTYNFGSVAVGETSEEKIFTINYGRSGSCVGTETFSGFSVTRTGVQMSQFDLSHDCPTEVGEGSCTATVTFSPDAAEAFLADLQAGIVSNKEYVSLYGTGTESPVAGGDATTALLLSQLGTDDSDGCNATASTGSAGKRSFGPTAAGLIALMGLVLGTAAVRRRMRRK